MEDFKLIPLTKGQFAKVDSADYEWLNQWKWQAWFVKSTQSYYAIRGKWNPVKQNMDAVRMHRVIMGCSEGDRRQIDHANCDTLDNRRGNLRDASHGQQQMNKRRQRNNTSGIKGVSWDKPCGKWRVRIMKDKKSVDVGWFFSLEEAGHAREQALTELHGEFARMR